jgi:hypothetical protein
MLESTLRPWKKATVVGTLTGGIQDVSATLPLLGTEQCEEHVSSALTNDHLYGAASPVSLFGSLGEPGSKLFSPASTLIFATWSLDGAQALFNMGFQPQGEIFSFIVAQKNKKDWMHCCTSTRLK